MDSALYLLTGAIFKGYDDITDGNKDISSFYSEVLKVLVTTLTTLSFVKSPSFAFFFCITSIVCLLNKSADTDFWKAWAIVPFVTILFHIPYFLSLSFLGFAIHVAIGLLVIFILVIEHKLFPEDMSVRKYITRIGLFLAQLIFAYGSSTFGFEYLVPLWIFYAGYFGINLVYHFPTFLGYFSEETEEDHIA